MQSYLGRFYEAGTEEREATILVLKRSLKIGYASGQPLPHTEEWPMADMQESLRHGAQTTFITLKGTGKQIEVAGDALFKTLTDMRAYEALPRYKKIFTPLFYKQLLAAFIIIALIVGGYFLLAPWLSGLLAKKLPRKYEISLGNAIYGTLMKTYTVDEQKTRLANEFFDSLHYASPYPVDVTVVKSKDVNAFALPGGHIVVYSAILDKLEQPAEFAALLAHEFTHVNERHATRSLFRSLGSRVFLSLLFGRTGVLTNIVLNNADNLKSLKYSRKLEKEADLEGLKLLKERNIDGRGFIYLMERLRNERADFLPEFVASHPDIDKRIAYIRENEHFRAVDSAMAPVFGRLFAELKGAQW